MRRSLAVCAALVVIAGTARGDLANGSWSGTARARGFIVYGPEGDVDSRGDKSRLPPLDGSVDLVTTDSGWQISGDQTGTMQGDFATITASKHVYLGTMDAQEASDWVTAVYGPRYAGWTTDSATGFLQFRTNGDGTRVKVKMSLALVGRVLGANRMIGTVTMKATLAP